MSTENLNNIRVAVIEPVGGHGGLNYYDFSLCNCLKTAGIDVILYTCDETRFTDKTSFKVKKYFQHIYGKNPKLIRAIRYFIGLIRSLNDERSRGSRIIHFHFFHTSFLEWFSIRLTKLYGFRIVITAHDVESFVGETVRGAAEKIYGASDIVIAHNQVSRKELIKGLHLPESKIRIISHGNYIDFVGERRTQQQDRERLGLQGNGPFLLFFGQLKKVKGLDILLNALPNVIRKFPSLHLIIAGKVWKDDFSKYQALIEKQKIGSNVTSHIRYIPDELVSYYHGAADLVVLPYKKIYQSSVLLMAMSYGCPVLASNLEGFTEVIQDNISGFMFQQGDSEHLAERLIEILSNPERMAEVAKAGYETIVNHYNWTKIGRQTAKVYKDLKVDISKNQVF